MDPDYIDDDYGDYFYDDEWLYIEDQVAFADELAETQIASPGYFGVNAEIQIESYEYDTYEYFGELEYGSDAYWDVLAQPPSKVGNTISSQRGSHKRKRASTSGSVRIDKRRKVVSDDGTRNVIYRETTAQPRKLDTISEHSATYALLPDWRERFPADMEVSWQKIMPPDMQRAAEAQDNNQRPGAQAMLVENDLPMGGEQEKPADEETAGNEPSLQIDADTLRSILRSKLGDAGLDEDGFLAVINDMLANGGAADDAIAQLAAAMLDEPEKNDASLDWLQDRGVAIERRKTDDDTNDASKRPRTRDKHK